MFCLFSTLANGLFGMSSNLEFASETFEFLIFKKTHTQIVIDNNICLKEFIFTVFIPITEIFLKKQYLQLPKTFISMHI